MDYFRPVADYVSFKLVAVKRKFQKKSVSDETSCLNTRQRSLQEKLRAIDALMLERNHKEDFADLKSRLFENLLTAAAVEEEMSDAERSAAFLPLPYEHFVKGANFLCECVRDVRNELYGEKLVQDDASELTVSIKFLCDWIELSIKNQPSFVGDYHRWYRSQANVPDVLKLLHFSQRISDNSDYSDSD